MCGAGSSQLLVIGALTLALVLTDFHQRESFIAGVEANAFDAQRHPLFAVMTGFSVVLFGVTMAVVSGIRRE